MNLLPGNVCQRDAGAAAHRFTRTALSGPPEFASGVDPRWIVLRLACRPLGPPHVLALEGGYQAQRTADGQRTGNSSFGVFGRRWFGGCSLPAEIQKR